MSFEPLNHRIQAHFTSRQTDVVHQLSHDVVRDCERDGRWLPIDGLKQNCEDGGDRRRLANIHIGVEVQLPVVKLGEQVDTCLAFCHSEVGPIQRGEMRRQRFEFLRVRHQACHFLLATHGAES